MEGSDAERLLWQAVAMAAIREARDRDEALAMRTAFETVKGVATLLGGSTDA